MELAVPETFWVGQRHETAKQGAVAASNLVATTFPPHPEDVHGALAVEVFHRGANNAIRAAVADPTLGPERIRWWLEGFICSLAHHTATALRAASDLLETSPTLHLADMSEHASNGLPEHLVECTAAFFDMVAAALHDDEAGIAWAVNGLFYDPEENSSAQLVALAPKVAHSCGAALMTCCGAWQLYLLATRA